MSGCARRRAGHRAGARRVEGRARQERAPARPAARCSTTRPTAARDSGVDRPDRPLHRLRGNCRRGAQRRPRGAVHAPAGAGRRTTRRCCRCMRHAIDAGRRAAAGRPSSSCCCSRPRRCGGPSTSRAPSSCCARSGADSVVTVVEVPQAPLARLRDADRGRRAAAVPARGRARHAPAGRAARLLARRHGLRVPPRHHRALRQHLRRRLPAARHRRARVAVDRHAGRLGRGAEQDPGRSAGECRDDVRQAR